MKLKFGDKLEIVIFSSNGGRQYRIVSKVIYRSKTEKKVSVWEAVSR